MTARAPALVVIGAILLGACACGSGSRTAARPSSLSWHTCGHFKCATLSVPVSYSNPSGPQVRLSVIELAAIRPKPIAEIVLNPGGPGESGVDFLREAANTFPPALRARFTLVSFDPRGVGASKPLRCLTTAGIKANVALNPAPETPKQIATVVKAAKAFVRGCERNASHAFIASMSTANTARDMDRLRAALGQKRLSYMGFSYGTYLGTLYAELFPKRIRAMVLDGAVDHSLSEAAADTQQAAGFESELHSFFAWCAKRSACRTDLSPSPARAYAALFAGFKAGHTIPAYLRPPLDGTRVDYGVALQGVAAALYSTSSWPFLGQALADATADDGSSLAALAYLQNGLKRDGTFSNIISANAATGCLDSSGHPTIRQREALTKRLSKSLPEFGPAIAWTGLACLYWPGQDHAHDTTVHAPGAPPILVVGSTGDPATPYSWAKTLARQLPRARLLTRTGAGHTAYRSSACIRKWVDRYFETLQMPPLHTVCRSD